MGTNARKMNGLTRKVIVVGLVLLCGFSSGLFAQEEFSGGITVLGSTLPEAKIETSYGVKIPLLQMDNALMSGNNLRVKGTVGVSPISTTLAANAILTPIAVVELNLGLWVGTGWGLTDTLQGIMLKKDGGTWEADGFGGIVYNARAGAAFQFDTGAVLSGDWSSVIIRTYHELSYQGYTNAATGDFWSYEGSSRKTYGFNYKGEYFLGYRMPLVLDTVGMMLEAYKNNVFDENVSVLWYNLGVVMNFGFTEKLSVTLLPQFSSGSSIEYEVNSVPWKFFRLAFMLNYAL
jgi:hypothetical protein